MQILWQRELWLGSGANECIWCDSIANGLGYIHSPTEKHET